MISFTRAYEKRLRAAQARLLQKNEDVADIAYSLDREAEKKTGMARTLYEAENAAIVRELIRTVRIHLCRYDKPIPQPKNLRSRYYHPTKGWRLPRRLRPVIAGLGS